MIAARDYFCVLNHTTMPKGYCMRDRVMVENVNPTYDLNKIGRPVARGTCPQCKGTVIGTLGAADVPPALKAKKAAFDAAKKKGGADRKSGRKSTGRKSARKSAGRSTRKSAGRR